MSVVMAYVETFIIWNGLNSAEMSSIVDIVAVGEPGCTGVVQNGHYKIKRTDGSVIFDFANGDGWGSTSGYRTASQINQNWRSTVLLGL